MNSNVLSYYDYPVDVVDVDVDAADVDVFDIVCPNWWSWMFQFGVYHVVAVAAFVAVA